MLHCGNPSGHTVALGSTQSLTELSTRNISWSVTEGGGGVDGGGRCLGLTNLPPSCADCHEIWEPHAPETLGVHPGLYRNCFTLYILFPPCTAYY